MVQKKKAYTALTRKDRRLLYNSYISSKEWKEFREKAFAHYGRKCRCGSEDRLEVHHKHYANFMNERLRDVIVLCKKCHDKLHKRKSIHRHKKYGLRFPQQRIETITYYIK